MLTGEPAPLIILFLAPPLSFYPQRGGTSGSGGSADGQLSDGQLNEMLARGEGEVELFEAEDARMQVGLGGGHTGEGLG